MKRTLLVICLFICLFTVKAQEGEKKSIQEKVELLNKAIFVEKDSLTLEQLLGKELIYGHSGGRFENRAEMIKGVLSNKSVYENVSTEISAVIKAKNTFVVRHQLTATEKDKFGKLLPLKLGVMQVWIKEKGKWKLISRQAVKLAV